MAGGTTRASPTSCGAAPPDGMIALPGGTFRMGSDRFYPEEAPARDVRVGPFAIDATPVTNAAFARFVAATGYRTLAETPLDPRDFPGVDPAALHPGSLVFEKTRGPVDLHDVAQWWSFRHGASWRRPLGPDGTAGPEDHPVVHVAYPDALAYARWAGGDLPTEAEWEYAARGGLPDADYAWGDELAPGGAMLANYWQGLFPFANQCLDGYERTSPVRSYPANGHGLYDMIGNVWEWTSDWYATTATKPKRSCCVPADARGARGRKVLESISLRQKRIRYF